MPPDCSNSSDTFRLLSSEPPYSSPGIRFQGSVNDNDNKFQNQFPTSPPPQYFRMNSPVQTTGRAENEPAGGFPPSLKGSRLISSRGGQTSLSKVKRNSKVQFVEYQPIQLMDTIDKFIQSTLKSANTITTISADNENEFGPEGCCETTHFVWNCLPVLCMSLYGLAWSLVGSLILTGFFPRLVITRDRVFVDSGSGSVLFGSFSIFMLSLHIVFSFTFIFLSIVIPPRDPLTKSVKSLLLKFSLWCTLAHVVLQLIYDLLSLLYIPSIAKWALPISVPSTTSAPTSSPFVSPPEFPKDFDSKKLLKWFKFNAGNATDTFNRHVKTIQQSVETEAGQAKKVANKYLKSFLANDTNSNSMTFLRSWAKNFVEDPVAAAAVQNEVPSESTGSTARSVFMGIISFLTTIFSVVLTSPSIFGSVVLILDCFIMSYILYAVLIECIPLEYPAGCKPVMNELGQYCGRAHIGAKISNVEFSELKREEGQNDRYIFSSRISIRSSWRWCRLWLLNRVSSFCSSCGYRGVESQCQEFIVHGRLDAENGLTTCSFDLQNGYGTTEYSGTANIRNASPMEIDDIKATSADGSRIVNIRIVIFSFKSLFETQLTPSLFSVTSAGLPGSPVVTRYILHKKFGESGGVRILDTLMQSARVLSYPSSYSDEYSVIIFIHVVSDPLKVLPAVACQTSLLWSFNIVPPFAFPMPLVLSDSIIDSELSGLLTSFSNRILSSDRNQKHTKCHLVFKDPDIKNSKQFAYLASTTAKILNMSPFLTILSSNILIPDGPLATLVDSVYQIAPYARCPVNVYVSDLYSKLKQSENSPVQQLSPPSGARTSTDVIHMIRKINFQYKDIGFISLRESHKHHKPKEVFAMSPQLVSDLRRIFHSPKSVPASERENLERDSEIEGVFSPSCYS